MDGLLFPFDGFEDWCELYKKHYNPPVVVLSERVPLKPKAERICLFCGRSAPSVSFHSKAHLISKKLGNQKLHSDQECDSCNSIFSNWENDLTQFVGFTSPLYYNRNSKPKNYNLPTDDLNVTPFEIANEYGFVINLSEVNNYKVDFKNGKFVIKNIKKPYTPLKIYKILAKFALSVLDENDLKHYQVLRKKLIHPELNYIPFSEYVLQQCTVDSSCVQPILLYFKRLDGINNIPLHFFSLYYFNQIIHFTIPLDYYEKIEKIHFPPPIFIKSEIDKIKGIKSANINLSSNEKKNLR